MSSFAPGAVAPDLEGVLPDQGPGHHRDDRVVLDAARAVHREVAAGSGLEAVFLMQGAQSELAHQLGVSVHAVGVVQRARQILGEQQVHAEVALRSRWRRKGQTHPEEANTTLRTPEFSAVRKTRPSR
nr:hypothetical protein [Streptomyces pluripotens]